MTDKKLIEDLFNTWTHMPRDNYPTWLELAIYMFEQGRNYQKGEISEALRSTTK